MDKLEAQPLILIVDDVSQNIRVLGITLKKEGYRVSIASSGLQAIELAQAAVPDLILLDVMMPGMNGFETCSQLKKIPEITHIPIIFLTAKSETQDILEGFKVGGVDFVSKPFHAQELLVRVRTQLDLKMSKDELIQKNKQLEAAYSAMEKDLDDASEYVESMLPAPLTSKIIKPGVDWRFIPSNQLGGDVFGYSWIDDDHFSIFLLDVCGHGVGAALLSVSVFRVLSSRTLGNTDFCNPAEVLANLNESFTKSNQRNLFFSTWYGVYSREDHKLKYSCAGHPPAVLLSGPDQKNVSVKELRTPGLVTGAMAGVKYINDEVELDNYNRLFIFSDGVYEVEKEGEGRMWTLREWINLLIRYGCDPSLDLDFFLKYVQELGGTEQLEDDFSLMVADF
ncbi:MAG: SpoIIE family protein phosphatase [bacterium]|nr:SpoIIE family protein phosphatase [bacterium]